MRSFGAGDVGIGPARVSRLVSGLELGQRGLLAILDKEGRIGALEGEGLRRGPLLGEGGRCRAVWIDDDPTVPSGKQLDRVSLIVLLR